LKRTKLSTEKVEFPDSIEIDEISELEKADPSMNVAWRGITIACNEDP
jgi:hypothetical protein